MRDIRDYLQGRRPLCMRSFLRQPTEMLRQVTLPVHTRSARAMASEIYASGMFLGFGGAIFSGDRFSFAHVGAALRSAVALCSCEVIDLGRQVYPYDCVGRTSGFGGSFVSKLTLLRRSAAPGGGRLRWGAR